jgi:hypothetical protein
MCLSGDGELHNAVEQGECLLASFEVSRRNALIQKAIIRELTDAILCPKYSFVVLGPQGSPLKLWQSYHNPSAGH